MIQTKSLMISQETIYQSNPSKMEETHLMKILLLMLLKNLAARDKWVADINFQPDKKIMIHGAIYTLQPGNFVDANRKGYARTKNSDGALENFWAEKYSVIAGGTGDSGLPYWDDTIIGHRDPRVLPLPDGPKSSVGYNGKVVSKERLLIEMTHGLGNLTKLSKENNLHTIIHATRQLP